MLKTLTAAPPIVEATWAHSASWSWPNPSVKAAITCAKMVSQNSLVSCLPSFYSLRYLLFQAFEAVLSLLHECVDLTDVHCELTEVPINGSQAHVD